VSRPSGIPLQQRRLVARPLRPVVGAVMILAAGLTAVLGVWLSGRRSFTTFDLRYGVRIGERFRGHERLALYLADLGGQVPILTATLAIAVVMLVLRRLRAVALVAIAPALATALTEWVLKPLIDRSPFGVYTFPSGHSTGAFAVAAVIVVLVLDETNAGPRIVRWSVAVFATALACLVALGLVAAGFHFVTDTIGGAGVGIATVLLVALAIDAIADRSDFGKVLDDGRRREERSDGGAPGGEPIGGPEVVVVRVD
jgi:membrane-associated phospholipid phosphatase